MRTFKDSMKLIFGSIAASYSPCDANETGTKATPGSGTAAGSPERLARAPSPEICWPRWRGLSSSCGPRVGHSRDTAEFETA